MNKALINGLKVVASVALLAVLVYQGWQSLRKDPAAYTQLVQEPKDWLLIGGALALAMTAVLVTFSRWYLLVRALGLQFSYQEAVRLGFVGYLFNFTLSIVGGDAIKAVAIAHRQPGRRTAAVATVVVDRIFGLYGLFVVGAIASLFVDFSSLDAVDSTQAQAALRVCQTTQVLTIVGAVGFALVLLPGLTTLPLWDALASLPKVGPMLQGVLESIRLYRRQPLLLLSALVMSLGVHSLYALSIYLLSRAFPGPDPSLAANFVVAPISMVAGAAPLPGGLGAFEGAFAFMYQALSGADVVAVQGLVIALAYRAMTLVIAAIGAVYYMVDRRQVKQLMAEVGQPALDEVRAHAA